ncbi:hypothetical protein BD413DRAFT_81384 [Trametes elegans]|nr:hypothetical protein BD413DRAFT_81384 [Trametes elegans]
MSDRERSVGDERVHSAAVATHDANVLAKKRRMRVRSYGGKSEEASGSTLSPPKMAAEEARDRRLSEVSQAKSHSALPPLPQHGERRATFPVANLRPCPGPSRSTWDPPRSKPSAVPATLPFRSALAFALCASVPCAPVDVLIASLQQPSSFLCHLPRTENL